MKEIKFRKTECGFKRADFEDLYNSQCSLQESSLATENAIWLGVHKNYQGAESTRMHLTEKQVAALLPHLKRFVETGKL